MQYTNPVPFSVRNLTSAASCICIGSSYSRTNPSRIPKDNVLKTPCRTKHWASMGGGEGGESQPYSGCWCRPVWSFWVLVAVYLSFLPGTEESTVYSVCWSLFFPIVRLPNGEDRIKLWIRKLKIGLRTASERSWTWKRKHCNMGLGESSWKMKDIPCSLSEFL